MGWALNQVLFTNRSIYSSNQSLDSDITNFYYVSSSAALFITYFTLLLNWTTEVSDLMQY